MSYPEYTSTTNRRVTPTLRSNIQVTRSTSITFNGRFTLQELREFVAACTNLNPAASVTVNKYAGDQRDGSSTTIVVNDA